LSKNKNHNDALKQTKNTNEQSKSQLFSEIDAKSVEVSGYTMGHGAPQSDQSMQEYTIPTGVVDFDESIVLPTLSSNSHLQPDSKPYKIIRPSQTHDKEQVHLPPIIHQPYSYYPYGCVNMQPNYHHCRHLHPIEPTHHERQSFHHIHPIHHERQSFQHHHNHHRHHKHRKTYDPRWWYMPPNTVHGPKSRRPHNDHYVSPKWYEVPHRQYNFDK
jgi:hypothetical protein